MRFINYVFYGAVLALIILSLGLFVLVRFNLIANPLPSSIINNLSSLFPRAYIVQSGSMSPAIKVGSIVVTQKSENYLQGDIITFKLLPSDKNPTTHRIYFKDYPEGVSGPPTYLTAGDANEDIDPGRVQEEQIVGKVVFTLPYAGYLAGFAKDPKGFILLVIVPATIIIYEELKFLKREFGKSFGRYWTKIRKKKISVQFNFLPEKGDKPLPKISILLPLIGAFLVVTSLSLAYFFDIEGSVGNIFQAGTWGPQIAQTLVINEVLPDSSCFQGQTEAQWLEIYNGYSITVNLKNFKITDGTNTIDLVQAASVNVAPGGFVLLAHSTSIFGSNKCYQDNGTAVSNLGGQLNIDVGHLQLLDSGNVVIDDVRWGTVNNVDTGLHPTQNQSIERNPDGQDTATGGNFNASDFVVQPTPQPGL